MHACRLGKWRQSVGSLGTTACIVHSNRTCHAQSQHPGNSHWLASGRGLLGLHKFCSSGLTSSHSQDSSGCTGSTMVCSGSSSAAVATVGHRDIITKGIDDAETVQDLLSLAERYQGHLNAAEWLWLLQKLFGMLAGCNHDWQCEAAIASPGDDCSQLQRIMDAAATALLNSTNSSTADTILSDAQRLRTVVEAMAVHAEQWHYAIKATVALPVGDCTDWEQVAQLSGGLWYSSSSCAKLLQAVAGVCNIVDVKLWALGPLQVKGVLESWRSLISLQQKQQHRWQQQQQQQQQHGKFKASICLQRTSTQLNPSRGDTVNKAVELMLSRVYSRMADLLCSYQQWDTSATTMQGWFESQLVDNAVIVAELQMKCLGSAQLLDAIAREVCSWTGNRHSNSSGSISLEAVVQLLTAYADMQYMDGCAPRMFDAVAGWIVKRIRSRDPGAPHTPSHLAAVAAVFARLQHRSVVMPELLNALARQACDAAAAAIEHCGAASSTHPNPVRSLETQSEAKDCQWTLHNAAVFLQCYKQLGYRPPELLTTSLAPLLQMAAEQELQDAQQSGNNHSASCAAADALSVLELYAMATYKQAPKEVSALLDLAWLGVHDAIERGSSGSSNGYSDSRSNYQQHYSSISSMTLPAAGYFGTGQLVSLLFTTAQLAAPAPNPVALAVAADALMSTAAGAPVHCNSSSSSSSNASRGWQRQLTAAEGVRVLWSLTVLGGLHIQRFGWLLVAMAAGSWDKLTNEQLVAIKQAEVALGAEGSEMAVEVLPAELVRRIEAAWQQQQQG